MHFKLIHKIGLYTNLHCKQITALACEIANAKIKNTLAALNNKQFNPILHGWGGIFAPSRFFVINSFKTKNVYLELT